MHSKFTIILKKIKLSELKYSLIGHVVKFKITMKAKRIFVRKSDSNFKIKKEFLSLKLLINQYKLVEANWP